MSERERVCEKIVEEVLFRKGVWEIVVIVLVNGVVRNGIVGVKVIVRVVFGFEVRMLGLGLVGLLVIFFEEIWVVLVGISWEV